MGEDAARGEERADYGARVQPAAAVLAEGEIEDAECQRGDEFRERKNGAGREEDGAGLVQFFELEGEEMGDGLGLGMGMMVVKSFRGDCK